MKPINTSLQQDVQEFLFNLCDRLEVALKDSPQVLHVHVKNTIINVVWGRAGW
jgi:hypothetical protein